MQEQKKEEGRAVVTPDLLLLDDVRINGVPCAWIDAKHFFGADLKSPEKRLRSKLTDMSTNMVKARLFTVMASLNHYNFQERFFSMLARLT